MAKFAYNNSKNGSTGHITFKLNCGYYPRILYKKEVNSHSKSKSADKLSAKLRELLIVCQENLKNFKSGPTIKVLSLEAMPPVTKYI